jgi:hypothetical protein
MSEVIAFHPRVSPLVNLYEVVDEKGEAIWGGNDTHEAIATYAIALSIAGSLCRVGRVTTKTLTL